MEAKDFMIKHRRKTIRTAVFKDARGHSAPELLLLAQVQFNVS